MRKMLPAALVVAGGVLAAILFVLTRPVPERTDPRTEAVAVHVMRASLSRERVTVPVYGTVIPAQQIALQAEVSGRVIEVGPGLVPGGRVAEGDLLVRIDPRDYELVVEQRLADVERAQLELRVETGRQRIAEREWKLLEGEIETSEEGRSLALREPHVRNLRAAVAAAKSGLEKARLDLERTKVVAPFNAIVQDEAVDVGQILTPQSKIGTLIGSDRLWVRASVPVDELRWIRLPETGVAGAPVMVVHEVGSGPAVRREGRLLEVLGDLDSVGRMARVLVGVEDPWGEDGALPLFVGAYVRIEIEGAEIDDVFPIPREALRDGNEVWIMDAEDRLVIRPVEIAFRAPEHVLVSEGLRDGERVITSRIATPLPRMTLRILDDETRAVAEAPKETDR